MTGPFVVAAGVYLLAGLIGPRSARTPPT
jgi:hypothetical protein